MSGPFNLYGSGGMALLGGGFGLLPEGITAGFTTAPDSATIVNNQLQLITGPGVTHIYERIVSLDSQRGAIIEARIQITEFKPRSRSGYLLIIDDASAAYALSFVDTEIGKFAGVCIRSGTQMLEDVGTEGQAALLSTLIDWTQPHTYRFERRPQDGVYLFIDNSSVPSIAIPDSKKIIYPLPQFSNAAVAFGHVGDEGCTSLTDFVRVALSEGYEISTKKVASEIQLEQTVSGAQAIVVVTLSDND